MQLTVPPVVPAPLRLLAFAASLRRESINRRLIRVAVEVARSQGAEVDLADFREFEMPLYDGDLQERSGIPPGAIEFRRRLEGVQGILLASPEYNYSLPGTLKNAIDWMSRMRPVPLRGKSAFLLAASGGQIGGIRGLWQLRIPLEGLGVFVHPDMYTLPFGRQAFLEDGSLADPSRLERLEALMKGYLSTARALASRA